jgi:AcrR family transcriptional regulator
MDAVAELSAEQGYEATKIGDIVRRAGVARKTLYDNFEGKEEVFLAAIDSAQEEALGQVEEACAAAGEKWADRLEAGLGALLAYLAENPSEAHMCMIDALSATPASGARYDDALHRYVELMRGSAPEDSKLPETIADTLAGGIAWILNQQIRRGEVERAPELLPELLEFAISPYRGVGKSVR